MNADALVKARIPQDIKERAVAALNKMGLSTSDVIRMVMIRVADEGRLPFEVKTPNVATQAAMEELDNGHGERFESADALFKDTGI
ncbi:DNA-damage-inducible protein J [Erwinia persicina]|jgi:DNA-damage-inducible protein J|uniref:Type II toxin-antitoxin system RelB/DinJ family antitoxin n=2 Tax=Erwinia TaxID=551 RepID=A0ABV4E8X3_9GAMM|nr:MULTISPECIES: type II toxin-antitoxin system RelB/DinJ family antitoxin [Erwinia]MCP1440090.1 DNA-damage-inducible protein J [Erwinia persicina]MDN4627620.1 type II toxin-antitoxin system RelB/DinJ family antitoxin [Erwinia sp. PsM31]MDN8543326.1 type II toxin-antitoxin system RelB/DinJ family antitoxin [Erwinia sp. BC051422]